MAENNYICLDDAVPPQAINLSDVTGLTVSAPVDYETTEGIEWKASKEKQAIKHMKDSSKKEQRKNVVVRLGGKAWDAFSAFFGEDVELPTQMSAEELIKTGRMCVSMQLSWSARGETEASEFVRDVANKLRHVDDEFDYAINTKTGRISKDEFKLDASKSVQWDKVRPNFDDLFQKMILWLEELQKVGKITL